MEYRNFKQNKEKDLSDVSDSLVNI